MNGAQPRAGGGVRNLLWTSPPHVESWRSLAAINPVFGFACGAGKGECARERLALAGGD